MFEQMHAAAKHATVLIAISSEGDQLRLSITPAPADTKSKTTLRPLTLLGTPAELDEGLADALVAWQSPPPRKSLMEQALAGADDTDGAPRPAKDSKATAPTKGKPGPKPKAKPDDVEPVAAALSAAAASTDDVVAAGSHELGRAAASAAASLSSLADTGAAATADRTVLNVDVAKAVLTEEHGEQVGGARANDPFTIDLVEQQAASTDAAVDAATPVPAEAPDAPISDVATKAAPETPPPAPVPAASSAAIPPAFELDIF